MPSQIAEKARELIGAQPSRCFVRAEYLNVLSSEIAEIASAQEEVLFT